MAANEAAAIPHTEKCGETAASLFYQAAFVMRYAPCADSDAYRRPGYVTSPFSRTPGNDAATMMLRHVAIAPITAADALFSLHSRAGCGGRAPVRPAGQSASDPRGPRRERLADPQVELVLGEPSLYERDLRLGLLSRHYCISA